MSSTDIYSEMPRSANGQVLTYFASPERRSNEEILQQKEELRQNAMLMTAFDAVPVTLLVLNDQRQIIGGNSLTREQFGNAFNNIFGMRPGEAFGCIHAADCPNGCGTAKACSSCGAVQAIIDCIDFGNKTSQECCLQTRDANGAVQCLELKVTVSLFHVGEKKYYSLVIEDIAQTKRLEVFQQLFFHDILNTIGCIKGYVDIIQYADTYPNHETRNNNKETHLIPYLSKLCEQLHDEVNTHRELLSAESGELSVQREHIRTRDIIQVLAAHYQNHEIGQGYVISVLPSVNDIIVTDRVLLMRVLGNMVKNAIEASARGSRITLQCMEEGGQVVFHVNNPGVIPDEVRYQIFKRSFSTKQKAGRGIGTYSMRLLGEKYLGGQVDFTTDQFSGTTFRLRIPCR
ncbi:MAG: sensor histidine kinase [Planctomycetaceae bacterium]|nr:sensor histidine kinase [Planctomycetaceae bacterium]